MTTLYVVQSEDGGIPDTPVVFTDVETARAYYRAEWREVWEASGIPADEIAAAFSEATDKPYDDDWLERGGVRMWTVKLWEPEPHPYPENDTLESIAADAAPGQLRALLEESDHGA